MFPGTCDSRLKQFRFSWDHNALSSLLRYARNDGEAEAIQVFQKVLQDWRYPGSNSASSRSRPYQRRRKANEQL